jgi:hypothetical protein
LLLLLLLLLCLLLCLLQQLADARHSCPGIFPAAS